MDCCLVVTTHERPDALARVLASLDAQTRPPDELVVADDGSGPVTAELVGRYAARARIPVRHAWQPHAGFRAGRVRNAAIAGTRRDYVLLLDGDMIMHPRFVEDHLRLARTGHYSQGVRVRLDSRATARALRSPDAVPRAADPGLGLARRAYAVHAPRAARALRRVANGLIAVKSCNQGFWRADLLRVNGFDEALVGWGAEDKELCARLDNAGVRRQSLLFAAIAYHLDHAPAPRDAATANRRRWQETVRTGRRRCEYGIDGHVEGPGGTPVFPSGGSPGPLL